jgi:hypothetical protein
MNPTLIKLSTFVLENDAERAIYIIDSEKGCYQIKILLNDNIFNKIYKFILINYKILIIIILFLLTNYNL